MTGDYFPEAPSSLPVVPEPSAIVLCALPLLLASFRVKRRGGVWPD